LCELDKVHKTANHLLTYLLRERVDIPSSKDCDRNDVSFMRLASLWRRKPFNLRRYRHHRHQRHYTYLG